MSLTGMLGKGCGIVGRGFHKETFDGAACVRVRVVTKGKLRDYDD